MSRIHSGRVRHRFSLQFSRLAPPKSRRGMVLLQHGAHRAVEHKDARSEGVQQGLVTVIFHGCEIGCELLL